MKTLKNIVLLFILVAPLKPSDHDYQPSAIAPEDSLTVLAAARHFPAPQLASSPANITFGCADIKYDGKRVMICECGDGIYMSLRPTNVEFAGTRYWETAPFWGLVWPYFASFGLPVWFVEDKGPKYALATEVLTRVGGKYSPTLSQLEQDPIFKKRCKRGFKQSSSIRDYAGIIVYRAKDERSRDGAEFIKFKQRHPEFLYVNDKSRYHLIRKHKTYELFQNAGLEDFVPQNIVLKSEYDENLARVIASKLKFEKYVVKPTFSSLSMGVNVVDRKGLDGLLKLIFKDKHLIPKDAHRCHNYWRSPYASKEFVAAEHMQSKPIEMGGKLYDPTLRVMFVMHHDKDEVVVNILGAFAKIPVKSLSDQKATLTEKHVTIAHAPDCFTGILVDQADTKKIKELFAPALAKAYKYLLTNY